MRFFALFAFLIVPLLCAFPAPLQASPETGQPAPGFTLPGADGETHSLSEYEGRIVVLEWTNHKCPYVQKHYDSGHMQALQKEATEENVVWLTIVSSAPGKQGHTTAEEARDLMNALGSHETARLLDPAGAVGQLYSAKTTPHMFVIDKGGTLVYKGAIDDRPSARQKTLKGAHNHVRAALDNLQAGEAVQTASTKPYGCSIKY